MDQIIYWEDASERFQEHQKRSVERFNSIMQELKDTCPEGLDARDFQYYAEELSSNSPDKKIYTANDCRIICMSSNELNHFDMMNTFMNDETDDIIDFF